MDTNGDEAKQDGWTVVCIGCARIKRNGRWTNERADDVTGRSSGFCDPCARAQRKLQQVG